VSEWSCHQGDGPHKPWCSAYRPAPTPPGDAPTQPEQPAEEGQVRGQEVWPGAAWIADTAGRCLAEGHHGSCRAATCPAAPPEPPARSLSELRRLAVQDGQNDPVWRHLRLYEPHVAVPVPGTEYVGPGGKQEARCATCGTGEAIWTQPPAEAQQDDGPPDEALVQAAQRYIADQVATWEVTFAAGPGEVVSLSDAAHAAARWHRSIAARPSADTETVRVLRQIVVEYRSGQLWSSQAMAHVVAVLGGER